MKTALILVNLGTPQSPTKEAVKPYLKQFLSDERVVDYPRWLWWIILNGIILRTRPKKTAKAYAKIWHAPTNESPLLLHTRTLAEKLQARLPHMHTTFAMRYGSPSIEETIDGLLEKGFERIRILPLYPQYSSSTTGTAAQAVMVHLAHKTVVPSVDILPPFYNYPAYLKALTTHTEVALRKLTFKPDALVCSFHGIPSRYARNGDPYPCHCKRTATALQHGLKWSYETFYTTYQSTFGPEQWLTPPTEETLKHMAQNGIKKVAITAPAFVADCVETLEELNIEAREAFMKNGGTHFAYLPALNSDDVFVEALAQIV